MGAGVLPVALHEGQLFFLFGEEADEHKWIDFGGGAKSGETSLQNAVREACEELNGFFGSCNEFKQLIKDNLVLKLNLENDTNAKTYTSFIIQIHYDINLPYYFNNHHKFIKAHLPDLICKNGLFEKRQVKWMTLADIQQKRAHFRHYYKPMLDQLKQHEAFLLKALKAR